MSEDTKLILEEIKGIRSETKALRQDMAKMEQDIREDMSKMERGIREDMAKMERGIREDMSKMEHSLQQQIKDGDNSIRLVLENEIRRDIRIIAEGHLNLNKKLNEILETVQLNETLNIRVRSLEKDMYTVKKRLMIPV